MEKSYPKDVAPVIDVFPDLCGVAYGYRTIRNKMELLSRFGFARVYLVVPPPGYPMFSNPWLDLLAPDNTCGNHAVESLLNVGDPLFEHVYEAHRVGMEAFAVMKPYEGGGGYTVPHGKKSLFRSRSLPCIGGERCGFDSFLRENPQMRVRRRPVPDYEARVSQPIRSLRLTFCLDQVEERIGHDQVRVFAAKPDESIGAHPAGEVRLWLSSDNGTYVPYGGPLAVEERLVLQPITDANGVALFEGPRRCREVLLTGLEIGADVRYVAVTFGLDPDHLVTLPFSMVKAYGDAGEVPITCTPYVRRPCRASAGAAVEWFDATYPETCDQRPALLGEFMHCGFEFEWYGSGHWGDGWTRGACLGIARGKMEYLKGTLCEAYSEVRDYWLEQVKKLVAMGFDGVDIRLQSHSAMVSDYFAYGYNEPLVAAYREAHGTDILREAADPLKLMRVRGRFFHLFLEDAARFLHGSGKKLQLHLRHAFESPRLSSAFGELGFWAMPKVLPEWEAMVDLADEVTIKDYNFGRYDAGLSSRAKETAARQGKPCWVHCYLAQGGDLNADFLREVAEDGRVTGVLLYEMGHNPYANNPWVGLIEARPGGEVLFNPEMYERLVGLLGYA